jgi:hypothetical protein
MIPAIPDLNVNFKKEQFLLVYYFVHDKHSQMANAFKIGDHVKWNSEAGIVSGKIIKVHTADFDYKGYQHRATKDDPQYEIKSDKTDHIAAHKGQALTKI